MMNALLHKSSSGGHRLTVKPRTLVEAARSNQSSDETAFDLSVDLEVDLDGVSFFTRRWEERIPRDLV